MFALSVSLIVPVLAHFVKLEAHIRLWIVDRDLFDPGRYRMFVNALIRRHVSKCLYRGLTVRVTQQILCPRDCMSAIAPVELGLVAWEMAAAELLVAADELDGVEASFIGVAPSIHMTSSPTRIDQFPMTVVNLDRVPSMARGVLSG